MARSRSLWLCVALCLIGCAVYAEGIGWRTDGTGKYPTATPPTDWAVDRNVVWTTPLPSWSNATPVVVGNRIFVCSEPDTLLCLDATTGQILWQKTNGYEDVPGFADPAAMAEANRKTAELRKQVAQTQGAMWKINRALKDKPDDADLKAQLAAAQEKLKGLQAEHKAASEPAYVLPKTYQINGFSTPTPVSDGQRVYALFGHGVAACYDLDGNRLWIRFIEHSASEYGHSTSPVLADGKLIVHILNLMALNPETGETLWQVRLPEDWGTPQVGRLGETSIIGTAAGDIVRASDGKVLARKLCQLEYGDPILADGVIYYIQNGGKAFKLPETDADPFQPQLLWQTSVAKDRYYAGSILHEGLIYCVTQAGVFQAVDAANGQVIYEQRLGLPPTMYPAITMAGNLLYVSSEKGITVLVKPGRQYEEAGRLTLEPFRACPVFIGNRAYIRTLKGLYCLGQG
ncbi:MAG: PQQ-like beta-propeller repeat protein [Armatimonadetes bacterium]|nr:PQQ-like beta-propeller repeat protein [Armatimonadota bacterium]